MGYGVLLVDVRIELVPACPVRLITREECSQGVDEAAHGHRLVCEFTELDTPVESEGGKWCGSG
jgi:hypothetical protein